MLFRFVYGAWLEHSVDFTVHSLAAWCVTSSLNRVDSIEGRILEWKLHEVSLHRSCLIGQSAGLGQLVSAHHLVVVDGDSCHICTSEFRNVSQRSANAAANIQNLVALAHSDATSQVPLVALDTLVVGLTLTGVREMEALTPSPLVEECGKL